MIEKNSEGRHQFRATPFKLIDAAFKVGTARQFFGADHFVTAPRRSDDLKLTVCQIEMDPIARSHSSQSTAIERFRNHVGN